jgi:hypothetical protein
VFGPYGSNINFDLGLKEISPIFSEMMNIDVDIP